MFKLYIVFLGLDDLLKVIDHNIFVRSIDDNTDWLNTLVIACDGIINYSGLVIEEHGQVALI